MSAAKREYNYDLLRILSTVAVVLIHINARYFTDPTDTGSSIKLAENFINIITRFSVPCFVMISGAFLLHNEKNMDYKKFYSKTFYKVVIPFIIISIFLSIILIFLQIKDGLSLADPINMILSGKYYNFWFMFMLFGLYLLTPIIVRIKRSISNKSYCIVSVVLMIFAVISQSTSTYGVSYSYGIIISYMAYFVIGNVVYENLKKGKKYAVIFSCLSLLAFGGAFSFRYVTKNDFYAFNPNSSFFSPFVVIGSIFVFIAFSNISIGHGYKKLPEKTYYIYMFHTVCYLTIFRLVGERIFVNEIVTIMIIVLATLIASWFVSTIYLCIWNALEKKFRWKEKWNKKFS